MFGTSEQFPQFGFSSLGSSSGIYGTTLPRMSSDGTPGYPAPDTACIVERNSDVTVYRSCNGAERERSNGRSAIGIRDNRATPSMILPLCIEHADVTGVHLWNQQRHVGEHAVIFALLNTMRPAFAKAISTSPATDESRAEKTTGDTTSSGVHIVTVRAATKGGISPFQPPCRLCIYLPRRTFGRRHFMQLKPRVLMEETNESLPNGASSA